MVLATSQTVGSDSWPHTIRRASVADSCTRPAELCIFYIFFLKKTPFLARLASYIFPAVLHAQLRRHKCKQSLRQRPLALHACHCTRRRSRSEMTGRGTNHESNATQVLDPSRAAPMRQTMLYKETILCAVLPLIRKITCALAVTLKSPSEQVSRTTVALTPRSRSALLLLNVDTNLRSSPARMKYNKTDSQERIRYKISN